MELKEFGPLTLEEAEAQQGIKEFGPAVPLIPPRSLSQKRADTYYFSSLFDADPTAIAEKVAVGATFDLEQAATSRVEANKSEVVASAIAEPQEDVGALVTAIQEEIQSIDTISRFAPPSVVAMLSSPDPIQRDYAARRIKRVLVVNDRINSKLQGMSEGFLPATGDFVDMVLTSTVKGVFTPLKMQGYVDRVAELIYSGVSDEELSAETDRILAEMSDQGWFTEENRFYTGDFLEMLGAGSESSVAKLQLAFGALDSLLIVGGGIAKGATVAPKIGAISTSAGATAGLMGRGIMGTVSSLSTDAARLIGYKTNDPAKVQRILADTVTLDDPTNASVKLGNHTSPSFATPTLQRAEHWSHTSAAAMRDFELNSTFMRDAFKYSVVAGEAIDDAVFNTLKVKVVTSAQQEAANSGYRRFLDADLVKDETENLYFQKFYGTSKGDLFRGPNGEKAAQNLADNIGGEVVVGDKPGTFKVVKTENIPVTLKDLDLKTLDIYTATNPDDLGEGLLIKYMGSPLVQTTERLNSILKEGEAARDAWKKDVVYELNDVKKLNSRGDQKEVFRIFEELRDGSLSTKREGLSSGEFQVEFNKLHGKPPTDAQLALYLRYQEALDTDAMFKADAVFKRQVAEGVIVDNATGQRIVAQTSDKIEDSAAVWDEATQSVVRASDLTPGTVVYRSYDGQSFKGDTLYRTSTGVVTRRLYHSDVVARNAGGPRDYRKFEIQYYIKQDRTKRFVDGSEVKVSPLTVMGVRTVDEANAAVSQINTIISAVAAKLGGQYNKASDYALALGAFKNDKALNDLIVANGKWNPDVFDVDSLLRWADESGVDLRKKFDRVRDGEDLIDSSVVGGFGGMTYGQALDAQIMNPKARQNTVLMGYGGKTNRAYDAQSAIESSLARSIAVNSDRAYMYAAINGFLRSAVEHNVLENLSELKNLTLKQKLMQAKIRDIPGAGSKLALEQKMIMFRMNQKGLGDAQWESTMLSMSNFLYGKGYKKTTDFMGDISSSNPATASRGFVFDAKLGMFNPAQYYVQGSQLINIMAVSPRAGIIGGALYGPLRFALANNNETVIRSLGKRLQPISGLSEDEFFEMYSLLKESGKTTVGVSLAEFGSEAASASRLGGRVGAVVESVRSAGRVFFNEGELIPRIASYATAYKEFLEQFPGVSASSQKGRRWIMNRQDVLTQAMTGASRTSVDRLPFTQFMSYMFRINEAIFAGSFGGKAVLTGAERARLALVHTVVFGASAWSATGLAMDIYRHYYGQELDPEVYRLIRKGVIDTLLTELTGTESSLSSRLSSSDGMFMLLEDFAEKNMLEFLGGPSIELASDTISAGWSAVKNLAAATSGAPVGPMLKDDMLRFVRLFSSGNQAYNAYTAFKYGEYLTRNNALLDRNVNESEAIFIAFGIPLEKHEDAWKYNTVKGYQRYFDTKSADSISRAMNLWSEAYRRGDYEEAKAIAKSISMKYNTMTPLEALRVKRLVRAKGTPIVDEILLDALKQGSGYAPSRNDN